MPEDKDREEYERLFRDYRIYHTARCPCQCRCCRESDPCRHDRTTIKLLLKENGDLEKRLSMAQGELYHYLHMDQMRTIEAASEYRSDPWFFWLMTGVLLGMGLMWVLLSWL
jgi:hypothetical protein